MYILMNSDFIYKSLHEYVIKRDKIYALFVICIVSWSLMIFWWLFFTLLAYLSFKMKRQKIIQWQWKVNFLALISTYKGPWDMWRIAWFRLRRHQTHVCSYFESYWSVHRSSHILAFRMMKGGRKDTLIKKNVVWWILKLTRN